MALSFAGRKTRILLIVLLLLAALVGVAYRYLTVGFGGTKTGEGIVAGVYDDSRIVDIPVAFDVTPDGRVFVVETGKFERGVGDNRFQSYWLRDDLASTSLEDREAYIRKWIDAGKLTEDWFLEPRDRVRVLTDTDADGRADSATVFAELQGLLRGVSAGVLVDGDSVYVTSIPEVLRFRDRDGDSVADEREVLSRGYGLRTAFVGHDLHGLTWGPEGKIYFSIGDRGFNVLNREAQHLTPRMDAGRGAVLRMNPDGSDLEVFAIGLRNPQELAFDNYGNLFTGDNNSDGGDKARIVYLVDGGDSGWLFPYQYQAEEDYLRGPWNAEKLWQTHHEDQPAWIVPPIANETNGPSGMSFYPGLGLPERYQNHFFLSNYSFFPAGSQIFSFAAEIDGAGFTLRDVHHFAANELFIDQAFGYDGKLYALTASTFSNSRKVLTFHGENEINDPAVAEVGALFREGFDHRETSELLALLDHRDRRVRREAQFALAERSAVDALANTARDTRRAEFARLHALWGLWQIGAEGLAAVPEPSDFADNPELLAQWLKVVGEVGDAERAARVRSYLGHDNARVRFFAAQASGRLGDLAAMPALIELAKENDGEDPFLRHAVALALARIDDRAATLDYADHESAAVRMVVLLALRHWGDERITRFLLDDDAALVVEAARAIYDLPIPEAIPALAALAGREIPLNGNDPQTDFALHRRILAANLRVGSAEAASTLAAYAASEDRPVTMRRHALEMLRQFVEPDDLEPVLGIHRPFESRPAEVVNTAIDRYMPALVRGDMKNLAMQVAEHYQRIPLNDRELLALVEDSGEAAARRLSALRELTRRNAAGGLLSRAIAAATASEEPALRAAALRARFDSNSGSALPAILAAARGAGSAEERQTAIALLAESGAPEAGDTLEALLERLQSGELDGAVQLDVIRAAEKLDAEGVSRALKNYRASLQDERAVRDVTRFGGDPERGKQVFENRGDCLRCHAVDGRGGSAGPDLAGIGGRYDADYLLDALVAPGKDIAPGYGMVSMVLKDGTRVSGVLQGQTDEAIRVRSESSHGEGGPTTIPRDQIESMQPPVSGMPPMGLVLSLEDLRDVMAYLRGLE